MMENQDNRITGLNSQGRNQRVIQSFHLAGTIRALSGSGLGLAVAKDISGKHPVQGRDRTGSPAGNFFVCRFKPAGTIQYIDREQVICSELL